MNHQRHTETMDLSTNAWRIDPTTEAQEEVIAGFRPTIPDAYTDGVIPIDALNSGLEVHAPAITSGDHCTLPGFDFELLVDDELVPGIGTTYLGDGEGFVTFKVPATLGSGLIEGFHDIAYRIIPKPFGNSVRSEPTQILVDRTPPGSRRLPRIEFPQAVQREGLSLASLLTMPGQNLSGIIADYADFELTDVLSICIRRRGGDEVAVMTMPVAPGNEATVVNFDRHTLEKPGANGPLEFYYYVADKAGNRSKASPVTPVSIFVIQAPESLLPPDVRGASDGLITDNDIKPSLGVVIPAMATPASEGDIVLLNVDDKPTQLARLTKAQASSDPMIEFEISYDDVWTTMARGGQGEFSISFSYTHVRLGVASRSGVTECKFNLSVPGGRDPIPATPENDGLPLPILRGASGDHDNFIGFEDAERDARLVIGSLNLRSLRDGGLNIGDVITAKLDGTSVGQPLLVEESALPITVTVPSSDLKANVGLVDLTYSVERPLAPSPRVATATSRAQRVRIETADGLPGGGKELRGALFTAAAKREAETSVYGLYLKDVAGSSTPLRIYGYVNMSAGDLVEVTYEAFDAFDGGSPVPSASGSLAYTIVERDLDIKDDDLSIGGAKGVFVDIVVASEIVRELAFGHFELSYRVTNGVGSVVTPSRPVLVFARGPKP